MKLKKFAYLYLGPGLDPSVHRSEIKTADYTLQVIGFDFNHKEETVTIAQQLVANGTQLIELCGGFGPLWVTKISTAINNQVPVGSVMYGPEARKPMLDLLSD